MGTNQGFATGTRGGCRGDGKEQSVFVEGVTTFAMIVKKVIGEPQTFAIEYSIVDFFGPVPYGGCRLWFEGNFLGDIEDFNLLTTIEVFVYPIIETKDSFCLDASFLNFSEFDIFERMKNEEINGHHYLPIEAFDAFYNYVYYREDFFHFLWMLNPNRKDWEEYENFPTGFFSAKVSIYTYEQVVLEFRNDLKKMCPQIFS